MALRVEVPDYKNLPGLDEEVPIVIDTNVASKENDLDSDPKKVTLEGNKLVTNADDIKSVSNLEKAVVESNFTDEAMECEFTDEKNSNMTVDASKTTGSGIVDNSMEIEQGSVNKLIVNPKELKSAVSNEKDVDDFNVAENKVLENSVQDTITFSEKKSADVSKTDLVTDTTAETDVDRLMEQDEDGLNDKPNIKIGSEQKTMEVEDASENICINQDKEVKSFGEDADFESKINNNTSASKEGPQITPEIERPDIDDISDEDSSSISEAMSVAHALLDSLSPGKSRETYVIPNSPRHSKLTASPLAASAPVRKIGVENCKPDSQTEGLIKTASYGFAVTELFPEDDAVSQENENQKENTAVKPSASPASNNLPEKLDLKTSTSTMFPDSPILVESSSSSQELPASVHVTVSSTSSHANFSPSIVQTSTNISYPSTSSVTISSVPDLTHGASSSCTSQAIICSIPTSVSAVKLMSSASENFGSNSLFQTSAPSAQTIISESISKPADTAVKPDLPTSIADHGYSRSYSEMPAYQSTPRKLPIPSSMMLKSPSGSIVLEDSVSSASFIEIPMEIDDRSPSGRKSQKRKRPALATEDVINYGKRRSARVSP